VVLTNPPFGANVGENQKVGTTDETRVPLDDSAYEAEHEARYGDPWLVSYGRIKAAARAQTKILDLYDIGKGKPNRATEILFTERCINLLRPGGRMGIVLPNGNLNTPSLAWLRRWAEGRAKLLAVIALPEETFRSAKATVTASVVYLRKFTTENQAEWEDAWKDAHTTHDTSFDQQRDELQQEYAERIIGSDDPVIVEILDKLAAIGVQRTLPRWTLADPPAYPRGVGATQTSRPIWEGAATDAKTAAALKRKYAVVWGKNKRSDSDAAFSCLKTRLRGVDAAHTAALWKTVRVAFDYPVFAAAPKTVGITSAGDTGETVSNELSTVLDAYRVFERWIDAGSKEENRPDFCLPSTV
jgi:type I restriction enzyme M protein